MLSANTFDYKTSVGVFFCFFGGLFVCLRVFFVLCGFVSVFLRQSITH